MKTDRKLYKLSLYILNMETSINTIHNDLMKIERDVELIKNILMSEGELTEWAKNELARAREEKEEDYTDFSGL